MRRALAALALVAVSARADQASDRTILAYLNKAMVWYRQQQTHVALATDQADLLAIEQERRIGREVMALAFDFARAFVALQPQQAQSQAGPGGVPSPQEFIRLSNDAETRVLQLQAEIANLKRRIARANPRTRRALEQKVAETQSELQLAQAQQETIKTMVQFIGEVGQGGATSGLLGQIAEMERSAPEAKAADVSKPPAAPVATTTAARKATPTGVLALTGSVLSLVRKKRAVGEAIALTTELRATVDKLQAPLVAEMRATLQKGAEAANGAGTSSGPALQQRTREIDQLTSRFKKLSAAVVPLGKQAVLLDANKVNLNEWHASIDGQYDDELRALLLHLGLLAIAVIAILAASEAWRHATFRYVRDLRRRQQSLVLRRIVVALALALMIAFSFVTELGSVATFAGFITAGLAVALQNVILSVAAYFFLIGKYGIRVGDHVSISGVTGDVMDIGLVRLHLMELRPDGLPTGRVVVFSNAVLFQPTANFFKQIPGSNFTWHQVSLTLSPDTDYRLAEKRLVDAVEQVYAEYRGSIAQQHQQISQTLSIPVRELRPSSQLHLTDSGLEMTIRFPVPLEHASTIDDRMTRALLEALDREPRLKLAGGGSPLIHPAQPA
jgi:small-conductance mechanosensitive channel/flagellar biosynthesis/type III secretory pathway chaperone